jgi:hypothetical protein
LVVEIEQWQPHVPADRVQEDLDAAEPVGYLGDDVTAGLRVEQVGSECFDVIAGLLRAHPDGLQVGLAEIDQQHPGALRCQRESAGAAKPTRADDQAVPTLQLQPVGSGHMEPFVLAPSRLTKVTSTRR